MKEEKNSARALALLALATNEDGDAGPEAGVCPDPEEIAAMAEGRLVWERRHRVTRHLIACPRCYYIWMELARPSGGLPLAALPPAWRWSRLSWKTFGYAGGILATVAVCLAVFLHPPSQTMYREEPVSAPAPASANPPRHDREIPLPKQSELSKVITKASRSDNKAAKPTAGKDNTPSMADSDSIPITMNDATKGNGSLLGTGGAEEKKAQESPLAAEKNEKDDAVIVADLAGKQAATQKLADGLTAKQTQAGEPTGKFTEGPAQKPAERLAERLAEKRGGRIVIGAIEVRRSNDQLAVWYGDLQDMCHQSHFVPEQWTALYGRGAVILDALLADGQDSLTGRLWLILGQMEGLTADRRQSFCAWSDKELTRKPRKKGR